MIFATFGEPNAQPEEAFGVMVQVNFNDDVKSILCHHGIDPDTLWFAMGDFPDSGSALDFCTTAIASLPDPNIRFDIVDLNTVLEIV